MKFKNNFLGLLTISLLFSVIFSFDSLQANPEHFHQSPEIKEMDKMNHEHHHNLLDVSSHSHVPKVELKVYPDKLKGWNLEIKTTNFTFTPENLGIGNNPSHGHAHLYVNGQKITRIYSNWYYISELPSGENEIKVTLNTDSHQDLVDQGQIIGDRIMINNIVK
jgi:hypothetical protein